MIGENDYTVFGDEPEFRHVPLGWHVISGESLLAMLRRVQKGEDPDLVYAEEYANADREEVEGE